MLLQALFLITTKGIPPLKEAKRWSVQFRDFVQHALEKEGENRPDSVEISRVIALALRVVCSLSPSLISSAASFPEDGLRAARNWPDDRYSANSFRSVCPPSAYPFRRASSRLEGGPAACRAELNAHSSCYYPVYLSITLALVSSQIFLLSPLAFVHCSDFPRSLPPVSAESSLYS